MKYNPFNKELEELNFGDIENLILSKIAEGWYVEYKRDIPKTKLGKLDNLKISKSIASFANTKGGWIIWGIDCNDKNYPVEIRGIDISEYRNFEDQISQIINSNISPKPFYHFKKIELDNKRFVFIIQVEESPTPPYITSQGIIYQRENNESKPITERYIVEKLNEKTNKYFESIERFTTFDLGETRGQSEDNQTYLELYLYPLPFGHYTFDKFHKSDFFDKVASRFYQHVEFPYEKEDNSVLNIPLNINFNSIFNSDSSIIIRTLTKENLIYKSTTAELFKNGGLKFLCPIHEFHSHSIPEHYKDSDCLNYIVDKFDPLETYDTFEFSRLGDSPRTVERTSRTNSEFESHIKFIDGSDLILRIMIIIAKYRAILQDSNFDFENKIGFRAKITECWRKFVFFDDDQYLEKLKKYNIPLSPKNEIEIPEFGTRNGYQVDLSNNYSPLVISKFILEGIGLPDIESIDYAKIVDKSLKRFSENNDS